MTLSTKRIGVCLIAACFVLLAACVAPPPSLPITRVFFYISADGWYRVTGAELLSAGLDLADANPTTFQLFRGKEEVAIRVQSNNRTLYLDFYGEAGDSPYSRHNVYHLRWGRQSGKRIRDTALPAPKDQPSDTVSDTMLVSRPTLYVPQAGDPGKSWFWQSLTAPATTTIPLTMTAALPTSALLRVNLLSHSQDSASPDHHVQVFLNEKRVADETWDGQGARTIEFNGQVQEGNNVLRLVSPGDTKAMADVVLLKSVEISYTRNLVAQSDYLFFQGSGGTYRVRGFDSGSIDIFDVTSPNDPLHVATAATSSGTVTFTSDAGKEGRWSVVGAGAYRDVERIIAAPDADLRKRASEADYVIITHPAFVSALQPLVKWREQRGLRPVVVTTDELYAEFGSGAESPLALRAFLNSLHPGPRFGLLVGKASYDYRNYLNAPNKNLVPTFLMDTAHLNQTASDNWFATDADDSYPTLAIGRIPAKTPDEVAQVVNKIIRYESATESARWRHRALFVADDKEDIFAEMSDGLANVAAKEMVAEKIYLRERRGNLISTRVELLSRWNAGLFALTYIGHGSIDTWAEGPLFSTDDLPQLKNMDRQPILFTPTCLDGFFYHPYKDSLAEGLLFKTDGGIIAGVVPTGLSVPEAQGELMRRLFAELYDEHAPTLGDALLRAKQKMNAHDAITREVVETFGLLGDPALKIANDVP